MGILEQIAILEHAQNQQNAAAASNSVTENAEILPETAENLPENTKTEQNNDEIVEGEALSRGVEDQLAALQQQKDLLQTMIRQQEDVRFLLILLIKLLS